LIRSGRKSKVVSMTKGNLSTIKSRILKDALKAKDPVVTRILTNAAGQLGRASVSINHIFNPQAILFGGGVIKACGFYMLPIINKMVKADPFFKKFNTCKIIQSQLGDNAVPLGAVRLVQTTK
jgi:glucokinase